MKAEEFYNNMKTPLPSTFDGYIRKSVMFDFAEQYADEISRNEYEKGVCDGKKARIKRVKTFWI